MEKYGVHAPTQPKTASDTQGTPKTPPQVTTQAQPGRDPDGPVTCPVCHARCTWAGCWHCPTHGTAAFE